MLKRVCIQNFGLIEFSEIFFDRGFTAVTGETGAGKSFLLRAIDLSLGARQQGGIKSDKRSVLETEFEVAGETHVFRRVLESSRSRLFHNDEPVKSEQIAKFRNAFLSIHGQHDNLYLRNPHMPTQVIDTFVDPEILADFQSHYGTWREIKNEITRLETEIKEIENQKDFWKFQFGDFGDTDLDVATYESESDALSALQKKQNHYQTSLEIKNSLIGDVSVLSCLDAAIEGFGRIEQPQKVAELNKMFVDIQQIAKSLDAESEIDQHWIAEVEQKHQKIQKLCKKYNAANIEILAQKKEEIATKIQRSDEIEDEYTNCLKNEKTQYEKTKKAAEILTKARKKAAENFSTKIHEVLHVLGLEKARIIVRFEPGEITKYGDEMVCFDFSANIGIDPSPIAKVASGGEMSRVMLGLKMFEMDGVRTMIFDEIDTGISGNIAQKMGEYMQQLGQISPLIVITHLPQIAASAQYQFQITKTHNENKTTTKIEKCTDQQRVEAIAQLMGDDEDVARKMLKN